MTQNNTLYDHDCFISKILEESSDILIILDSSQKIISASTQAISYFDLSPECFFQKDYESVCKIAKREFLFSTERKWILEAAGFLHVETNVRNKQNQIVTVQWSIFPLQKNFFLIMGKDVSLKNNAREQAEKIQNYLQELASCMPGNFYWKDKEGYYLGCNNSLLKTLSLQSTQDIIGKTDWDLWPKQAEAIRKNDQEVMNSGQPIFLEEKVTLSGREQFFTVVKAPLKNEAGEITGIIGNSLDITLLKEAAEAAAAAAATTKSEFLANISHDFITQLTIIVNGLDAIKSCEKNADKRTEFIRDLKETTLTLIGYVQDILEIAKLPKGDLSVKNENVNLYELISKTVANYKELASKRHTVLSTSYPTNMPHHFLTDQHRIQRILNNLLDNAIKFTERGDINIQISVLEQMEKRIKIRISIIDSGIGIPKEKFETIFDQFVRLDPAYHGHYKGAGLGLSVVKEFVQQLGGKITVESTLGKGTTFHCDIICETVSTIDSKSKATLSDQSQSNQHKPNLKHLKILLVEDEVLIQKFTRIFLEEYQCEYEIADTAAKAITAYSEKPFDLILLDLGLPDHDGFFVAEAIRSFEKQHPERKPTVMVALTAHVEEEKRIACIAAGMNHFCKKPLSEKLFIDLLKQFKLM